jgi:serine/threonine protein kinase
VQVRQLDESDIIIHKEIGSGSFSVVYRGEYHGRTVAVKRYISKVVSDPSKRNAVRREVGVLAASKGPLIVGLVGISVSSSAISVVLEYVRFGAVQRHIDQQRMPPLLRMKCILDTARGMKFLHSRGIIYRDLKPENLLLYSMDHRADVCVKIADFGTGRKLPSKKNLEITKHVGTPIYMAPEILEGADYSLPADVYSFGISSWEIWTLNYAFDEYDTEERLTAAVCRRLMRPILPDASIDEEIQMLIDELPFSLDISSSPPNNRTSSTATGTGTPSFDLGGRTTSLLPPKTAPLVIPHAHATALSKSSQEKEKEKKKGKGKEKEKEKEKVLIPEVTRNARNSLDGSIFSRLSLQEDERFFGKDTHMNKAPSRPQVGSAGKSKPWFVFPKDNEACDFPYPFAPLLSMCWHKLPKERPPFWFIIEIIEEIFLELNRLYEQNRENEETVRQSRKEARKEKEKH